MISIDTRSGKIRWGENPRDSAKREFLEESGLTGNFSLKQIAHYQHYHKDGRFLKNKYFWVFRVGNVQGKLKKKVPEGENVWLTEKDYRSLKNTYATVDEVIHSINSKKLEYVDKIRIVESY